MALPGESPSRPLPPAGPPPSTEDWPITATDAIVRAVDSVRDKTTGPALNAARMTVYGLVLVLLAIPLFILLLVGAMRAVEHLLAIWLPHPMWLVYLLFGSAFLITGLVLWSKAHRVADVPA